MNIVTRDEYRCLNTCSFEFRGAVCLNNVGVQLLERHCYGQAQATFRAAVSVMKNAVLPRNTEATLEPARTTRKDVSVDVDNLLHEASKRLANPKPSPLTARVQVQGIINLDSSLLRPRISNSTYVLNPLRIDDILLSEDFDAGQVPSGELEAACMLHNFGLSWVCQGLTCGTRGARERFRAGTKLFDLALAVLDQLSLKERSTKPAEIILSLFLLKSIHTVLVLSDSMIDLACWSILEIQEQRAALLQTLSSLVAFELLSGDTQKLPASAA